MRRLKALAFILLMLGMSLSGCVGEPVEMISLTDEAEDEIEVPNYNISIDQEIMSGIPGEDLTISGKHTGLDSDLVISSTVVITHVDSMAEHNLEHELSFSGDDQWGISLSIDDSGIWSVDITFMMSDGSNLSLEDILIETMIPTQSAGLAVFTYMHEFEFPVEFELTGTISHEDLSSCSITFLSASQVSYGEVNNITGSFSIVIGMIEESLSGNVALECGTWEKTWSNRSLIILISGDADDSDGDGISDANDGCPDGWGDDDGWSSNPATDVDGDGCHDAWEDTDDDGDGISDGLDYCPQQPGWNSSLENDHDSDGCRDIDEDDDDDGDGVLDAEDSCPRGATQWNSGFASDWDSDGCRDVDEDGDDDSDGLQDEADSCPKGASNWTRDATSDWDSDGCRDLDEDLDDDEDGVNDVNGTGAPLDLCPFTEMNRSDVDENGCAGNQRDSDGDGVLDDADECPDTPVGNPVSSVGCADLDGDGVFSNVDVCPDTPARWTPDVNGCTVNQIPVAWNTGPYGSGRMDIVSSFSFPTLSGTTWNFQNEWSGNETYLFLFKYTDGSGNSNSGTWAYNPGAIIRKLPDNVHLFYGSFDSSYHDDVVNRKADVESRLSTVEKEKWMPRIHFIDQRGTSINGGLGQLIQNWGTFYYGIDRFQQSREVGSLHDWSQGTSCCTNPTHFAHEPNGWNSEFTYRIRTTDPGITKVPIFEGEWHVGGWQGGYTSSTNATFPNASVMSTFDTMEVYAYHSCEDHRNRHSSGGCHEWDYLHYLKICELNNSSSCSTEFVRYITTYGREGQWLTDITPYLFMVMDGGTRRFLFQGANKMGMEMTVLLSNWGETDTSFSAEYAFSGGQFKGQYNNQSQYKRQHLFTPPDGTDRVEIVATITGHGFASDDANCSEFCNHEHHYTMNGNTAMEDHPTVGQLTGCQNLIHEGVVANQYGSWPYGRAGWCAGQDVKQWRYDITSWVNWGVENNLSYRGLYQGQEYVPTGDTGGDRNIRVATWLVYYNQTGATVGSNMMAAPSILDAPASCQPNSWMMACLEHVPALNADGMMTSLMRY